MDNPVISCDTIFKPNLTDEQIAQNVRKEYDVVLKICAKMAAYDGRNWRSPGSRGIASNAQLWILGACLGHASTQETDRELGDLKDWEVERLWADFTDIPMNPEAECTETEFLGFPVGTAREDIWKWFDSRHSKGVAYLLMG